MMPDATVPAKPRKLRLGRRTYCTGNRMSARLPPRLGVDAVPRVYQDVRELRRARAGGHVPRVLLVSGRVGDDELALVGREVAVGDVDRDPLLALGLQAVGQQRQVDLAAA